MKIPHLLLVMLCLATVMSEARAAIADNVTLQNLTYSTGTNVQVLAGQQISANTNVIVTSGASVNYIAGSRLVLSAGFNAQSGSTFRATVDTALQTPTGDSDGDGMPDWWEYTNGLNPYDPADASADPDRDGLTNINEYRLGKNPRSPDNPPTVTATVSDTSIGVGQSTSFWVAATGGTGLSEIGCVQCTASGAIIANIGSSDFFTNWGFSWMARAPGTYYFKGYAKAGAQTIYTDLKVISVATPVPSTRALISATYVNYNSSDTAYLAGGQTIIIDTVTGYVIQGLLVNDSYWVNSYLKYGPDQSAQFKYNSLVKFGGGYVSDGYLNESGSSVALNYGPNLATYFYPQSHVQFSGGYVTDGYMNNSGTAVSLYYGPGLSTSFYPQSHIKFSGGYVSEGYMNDFGTSVSLYYGPGRTTDFFAQSHIKFSGGYVSEGYLNGYGTYVSLYYGNVNQAHFLPQSCVKFA